VTPPVLADILFVPVMMGVRLARFGGMVMGVMAVARGGVGVMRRGVGIFLFIVLGGFAVMMRGLLVMVRGVMVMLAGGVLVRHGELPVGGRALMARRSISLGVDSRRLRVG
jgi:hypothetical protein